MTAPSVREALHGELSDMFERFLAAHDGDRSHLESVLREWLWDNKAGLVAALATPPAPAPTPSAPSIPLADHDRISQLVLSQPWEVQQAVVTIAAHCTALKDECPTGQISDLAGCISLCCLELAHALATPAPSAARERVALAEMVFKAVKFADVAAGEGIFFDDLDPAVILSDYATAIDTDCWDGMPEVARDTILALLPNEAAIRANEREKCARVAEGWITSSWNDEVFAARSIAADIRAEGGES